MKLVRYNGELWVASNNVTGLYTMLHPLRGGRFDIAPTRQVKLVGNNYKPTATDTKESGPSSHES